MTSIDVAPLVGDIEPTPVTFEIPAAPAINDLGEATYGAPTLVVRSAVVHPADGRTLERMGLDSARETIMIYDTQAIAGVGATRPQVCQYAGRRYEVVRVEDYSALGGLYIVSAALLDDPA